MVALSSAVLRTRVLRIAPVVLLILIVAALFLPIDGDRVWHRILAVYELRDVQIAESFNDPFVAYSFGFRGLKTEVFDETPNASVSDVAWAQNARAVIIREEGGSSRVELLGPEAKTLSSESGAKLGVAVSANENFVAFSVAPSHETAPPSLADWEIRLVDLGKDMTLELGNGFGGQFFVRDGVTWFMYVSTSGITVLNTDSLKSFTTPVLSAESYTSGLRVSPDGSYIAFRNPVTFTFGLYEVYRIGTDVPLGIRPVETDLKRFADVLLTDDVIYGVDLAPIEEGRRGVRTFSYTSAEDEEALYTFTSPNPLFFVAPPSL